MVGVVQAVLYGGVMLCRVVSPHYDDWYCREKWSPRMFAPANRCKWVALLTPPTPISPLFFPLLLHPPPPPLLFDLLMLSPVSVVNQIVLLTSSPEGGCFLKEVINKMKGRDKSPSSWKTSNDYLIDTI